MRKYTAITILAIVYILLSFSANAVKPSDFDLKEGDLISAIFSDDPDVYIINEQGYKRLFLNPEIFNFYGHLGGFVNVKLVTPEVRDAFVTSSLLRDCETNDPKVYGVEVTEEDSGKLRWINVTGDMAIQEDHNFFKKVFCINQREYTWYPKASETINSVNDVPVYSRSAISATSTIPATPASASYSPTPTPTSIPTPTPIFTVTPTPTSTPTPSMTVTPSPTSSPSYSPTPTPTPTPTSYEDRIIRITTNSADQDRPAISGNRIVWSDSRNVTRDIYMYDLITSTETRISNGSSDEFDPHIYENLIVYRDTSTNIYLYDINTNTSQIIGAGTLPKIDGNRVVYSSYPSRDIYVYYISTGNTTLISTPGDLSPYISGNDVVYGSDAVYHYDLNSGIERVIASGNIPFRPSVSNGIATYTKRSGDSSSGFDMYIYNLNTSMETKLTTDGGGELTNISISANRVVWSDSDDYNIYLYNLSTNQLAQLTSNSSPQYHSYINSNRVVWADYRNGNFDIYLLEL